MDSPFVFSKVVTGDGFVGRDVEMKKLENNFRDGINTFIISARRTGKSSLVQHTVNEFMKNKEVRNKFVFVSLNLWNVRTEQEFYEMYANKVLKAAMGKFTSVIDGAKTYLSNLKPVVKLEYESLKFDVELGKDKEDSRAVLELPQKLAQKKNKKFVVCLDEFQDVEYFKESLPFQKNLRAVWQNQPDVSYILYGSKRHMMTNLFNDVSMPFYRFGDVMYLKKIEREKLVDYIVKVFARTKKQIQEQQAEEMVGQLRQHPYYIQQLGNIVWQNTDKKVTDAVMETSMEEFLGYNSGQFEMILRALSLTQLNFLKAVCHNEKSFYSQQVLGAYKLGSSANVTSIKRALLENEFLEDVEGSLGFTDPVFEMFFRKMYKIYN